MLGAGAIIDANTGHVLDYVTYETMSKYCDVCSYKKKTISEEIYEEWHPGHVNECHINFEGSSGAMEARAAIILWGRSLSHKMRYTTFISDGDSSAFLAVSNMNNNTGPYGKDHPVAKEECINHVSKRLRTALRKLCKTTATEILPDGSKRRKRSLGGRNRLTDNVITRLQYYFGLAVRRNTTVQKMRDDIVIILSLLIDR